MMNSNLTVLDELIYDVIAKAKKRASSDPQNTLLDMMIEGTANQGLTDKQLRDNTVVYFVAGMCVILN